MQSSINLPRARESFPFYPQSPNAPLFRSLPSFPKATIVSNIINLISPFLSSIQLSKWQTNNLLTHICALALTIDNFTSDTNDIRADLRLETREFVPLTPPPSHFSLQPLPPLSPFNPAPLPPSSSPLPPFLPPLPPSPPPKKNKITHK